MRGAPMTKGRSEGSGGEIIYLWNEGELVPLNRYRRKENDLGRLNVRREPRWPDPGRRSLQWATQGKTQHEDPGDDHQAEGSSPCLHAQHEQEYITTSQAEQ